MCLTAMFISGELSEIELYPLKAALNRLEELLIKERLCFCVELVMIQSLSYRKPLWGNSNRNNMFIFNVPKKGPYKFIQNKPLVTCLFVYCIVKGQGRYSDKTKRHSNRQYLSIRDSPNKPVSYNRPMSTVYVNRGPEHSTVLSHSVNSRGVRASRRIYGKPI